MLIVINVNTFYNFLKYIQNINVNYRLTYSSNASLCNQNGIFEIRIPYFNLKIAFVQNSH